MLPEKKQVLIVDDEPNLRKILSAQLTRDGYDVMTAEDGEQGLSLLREQPHRSGHHRPEDAEGRRDDAPQARRSSEDPELPVVMITAHGDGRHARSRR